MADLLRHGGGGAMTDDGRRFGDGLAAGPDLEGAAEVAVAQALEGLDGARPDLLAVFVAPAPQQDPDSAAAAGRRAMELAGARAAFGATASGVIGDGHGRERGPAVAVWAAVLPGVEIETFPLSARLVDGDVELDGIPGPGGGILAAVLDPYTFPVTAFLERIAADLPVIGGLAGASGPGSTRLFVDGEVLTRGGVAVRLGPGAGVRTVVSQGCRPIGEPMTVTGADRNLMLELAGMPAYQRLVEIVTALPPAEQQLVARGLHVGVAIDEYADEHGRGDYLVRGVLGVDERSGAVAVGDVVEVGQTVRFQVRDAAGAGEDLAELLGGRPARGALLFSCNGRGTAMFPPTMAGADHDVRTVRAALLADGVAGFFAAGELGPVGGRNHLHAFTASVLAFE